jgi:hypothetical protein
MNEAAERKAAPVLDALVLQGLSDSATVVLIGSSARGTTHEGSDIDILVIHEDDRRIRLDRPGDIHLQQESRSRFLQRLENGDDYPGWALRFGIPVRAPGGWWAKQVAVEQENPHWPDWRPKAEHARKRILTSGQLLDVGDVYAASEEMMFAASHVARAVLLKHGQFPLSRMELPSQLEDMAPDLACLLRRLIDVELAPDELRSGEVLLRRYITEL